jgi:hypothetical protein
MSAIDTQQVTRIAKKCNTLLKKWKLEFVGFTTFLSATQDMEIADVPATWEAVCDMLSEQQIAYVDGYSC